MNRRYSRQRPEPDSAASGSKRASERAIDKTPYSSLTAVLPLAQHRTMFLICNVHTRSLLFTYTKYHYASASVGGDRERRRCSHWPFRCARVSSWSVKFLVLRPPANRAERRNSARSDLSAVRYSNPLS